MKIYLVGGAVRDELLGLTPNERDWVVVGESKASMIEKGFIPVGQFFPVYLHPKTKEEYALARLERSTGPGYGDFDFDTAPHVSLEEDLQRRDLTINAIAKNDEGEFIDPYGGIDDLNERVLRHVSPAFSEDPLRVLRIARLKAQLAPFDFSIADATFELCCNMVEQNDLSALAPERVFIELKKALESHRPSAFFSALAQFGALEKLLPALSAVDPTVLDPFFPTAPITRFARLCAEAPRLAKVPFPKVALPKTWLALANMCNRYAAQLIQIERTDVESVMTLLTAVDARRHPDRFKAALDVAGGLTNDGASWQSRRSLWLSCLEALLQPIEPTDMDNTKDQATQIRALQQSRIASALNREPV
jgi:tRNA nucleotidyltransferase (CCA-adding enzyme)